MEAATQARNAARKQIANANAIARAAITATAVINHGDCTKKRTSVVYK